MATTWSRVTRVVVLLLATQLSACYDPDNKPATTTLDSFPKGIAFDNEDNLYIATVTGNIFRIDGQQQQLSKLLVRGDHGLDLAENIRYSQNKLFIHNKRYAGKNVGYIDEVLLFSTEGEFIDELITEKDIDGTNFTGISVNRHAQLYSLTDAKTAKLIRINLDKLNLVKIDFAISRLSTEFATQTDNLLSTNLADINTNLTEIKSALNDFTQEDIVTEEDVAQLSESINNINVDEINYLTSLLVSPNGITTDKMNNIYVSFIHSILKFDMNGNYLNNITPTSNKKQIFTNKMAVDPYGNLVIKNLSSVNNTTQISFTKYDPDGHYLGVFIPPEAIDQNASIQDIAFDSAGNFYLVDTLKGIYKFNSSGQFVSIIVKPF